MGSGAGRVEIGLRIDLETQLLSGRGGRKLILHPSEPIEDGVKLGVEE